MEEKGESHVSRVSWAGLGGLMGAWVGCVYLLSRLSHNRLDVIEDRYREK